jgi:hypothetical protein
MLEPSFGQMNFVSKSDGTYGIYDRGVISETKR